MRLVFLLWLLPVISWAENSSDIETIYVVQPKAMTVTNRAELSLMGMQKLNSRVVGQTGISLNLTYHIQESLAVQFSGAWFFLRGNSEAAEQVKQVTGYTWELAQFYSVPWFVAANFLWVPVYGKVSFHDLALGSFGIFIKAGFGVAGLELNDLRFEPAKLLAPAFPISPGALLAGGVRFYFVDHLGVYLEVGDFMQALSARKSDFANAGLNDPVGTFSLQHLLTFQLGLSYVF